MGSEQQPTSKLLEVLPDPIKLLIKRDDGYGYEIQDWSAVEKELEIALPKLRDLVENCPACIMAALRQKNIPVPIAGGLGFNFTEECKSVWADTFYYLSKSRKL